MAEDTPVHRKLRGFIDLSDGDLMVVDEMLSQKASFNSGSILIGEGMSVSHAYVLLEGWAFRFKMFQDGRRQISRLFLPGDFIGLNSSLVGVASHSVAALTDVVVGKFNTRAVAERLRTSPQLWLAALWSYTRDRSIMDERIASIGRRSAYERIAHIIVELHARLKFVGRADDNSFSLPLTQEHLADLLGLTSIHVNRTLGRLKQDGLIAIDGKIVRILRPAQLGEVANFHASYLMQGGQDGARASNS